MMMNAKFALCFLLLCGNGVCCRAQIRFTSLEEVLGYADQNAMAIRSARSQELTAASRSRASKAAVLPALNASAGFNDNITLQPTLVPANLFNPAAPEGTFKEYTFGRKYVYSTGVQASWDVINFQKWFDTNTTQAAGLLSEANTRNARFQVYNQLAQTYFSILLTKKYLDIANRNIAASDTIYTIAQDKYERGLFSQENLNRSKIQQVQSRQQAAGLSASLAQLYNQMASQLNTAELLEVAADLSDTLYMPGNQMQLTAHPQVQVQQAQLEVDKGQLRQTRSLQYPVLTAVYQFNRNWATDRVFDWSSANHLPQQLWGLKLSIPVFNGMMVKEKVAQAQIQLRQQQQLLDSQRLTAQKEDDNLRIQCNQSADDLRKQSEILRLQADNDLHTQDRYQSGIIGLDERLDKFQDLLQVQNQYMQSLSNYYISYYKRYLRTKI